MEDFREQVLMYKTGDFSDFSRMKLAYAFQDLVAGFKHNDKEIAIEAVLCILDLHRADEGLMKTIGYDLLEASIKLHMMFWADYDRILYDFSKNIAFSASAKELLIQLNALMVFFSGNEEVDIFKDINEEGKTVFKMVVTFYLSIILTRIEEKHLKTAVQELYVYIEMMSTDLKTNQVLGLEIMNDLLESVRTRSFLIKVHAREQVLKFLLELTVLYEKSSFEKNYERLVELIREMFGNFEAVLIECWKFEKLRKLNFLPLCGRVVSNLSEYKLPYVYSGCKRFQILVVNCIKDIEEFPEVFLVVFNHAVMHLEEGIVHRQLLTNYSSYNTPTDMIADLVHTCGLFQINTQKLESWNLFLALLKTLLLQDKVKLVCSLLTRLKHDQPKSYLLDSIRKDFRSALIPATDVMSILLISLNLPQDEHVETLQSSALLYKQIPEQDLSETEIRIFHILKEKFKSLSTSLSDLHSLAKFHLQDL